MRSKFFILLGLIVLLGISTTSCGGGSDSDFLSKGADTNEGTGEAEESEECEPGLDVETAAKCSEMNALQGSGLSMWIGLHCGQVSMFAHAKWINTLNQSDVTMSQLFCKDILGVAAKVPSWEVVEDLRTAAADYCSAPYDDGDTNIAALRQQFCDSADLVDKMFSAEELEEESAACDGISGTTVKEKLQKIKCVMAGQLLENLEAMEDIPDSCF